MSDGFAPITAERAVKILDKIMYEMAYGQAEHAVEGLILLRNWLAEDSGLEELAWVRSNLGEHVACQ